MTGEKDCGCCLGYGLTIPDEIRRREDRKSTLNEARKVIEECYEEIKQQKQAENNEKQKNRGAENQSRHLTIHQIKLSVNLLMKKTKS